MSYQPRILLIGGTSHVGKSAVAAALAGRLGWETKSTDTLARHPGRPWQVPPERVDYVADYYRNADVNWLVEDVLRHYTGTIWPMAKSIIATHATDAVKPPLVMEGSALWPDLVATLEFDAVVAVWLTASDDVLTDRMRRGSGYDERSPAERKLIDRFLGRTLAFNRRMMRVIEHRRLLHVDVDASSSPDMVAERCLALFADRS